MPNQTKPPWHGMTCLKGWKQNHKYTRKEETWEGQPKHFFPTWFFLQNFKWQKLTILFRLLKAAQISLHDTIRSNTRSFPKSVLFLSTRRYKRLPCLQGDFSLKIADICCSYYCKLRKRLSYNSILDMYVCNSYSLKQTFLFILLQVLDGWS